MKIKMFIPIALVLCLAFSLCACTTASNTNETTAATPETTAAATEAETTAPAETTAAAETEAPTETAAETETAAADFTEEDALELVKSTYEFSDEYFFLSNSIIDIDGTSYYAVDLRKSLEANTTYISTYFVTLDGSEIHKGYISGGVATISDETSSLNITEDNAVKAVEAAYDFEDGCFLTLRGVEEIDGVTYYAVDLRKSLEANTTYLSTYFVAEDGTITLGYYEGDTPVISE